MEARATLGWCANKELHTQTNTHPFQPSSISFLRVGNTFSISSPFDVTKLQTIVLMYHRLLAFHS